MFDLTKSGLEAMLHGLTDLDCTVAIIEPDNTMVVSTELTNGIAVFHVEQTSNKIIKAISGAVVNCKYDCSVIGDMFLNVQFVIL